MTSHITESVTHLLWYRTTGSDLLVSEVLSFEGCTGVHQSHGVVVDQKLTSNLYTSTQKCGAC